MPNHILILRLRLRLRLRMYRIERRIIMRKFLEEYVEMIAENYNSNSNITKEKVNSIVEYLIEDEEVWDLIDSIIIDKLDNNKEEI